MTKKAFQPAAPIMSVDMALGEAPGLNKLEIFTLHIASGLTSANQQAINSMSARQIVTSAVNLLNAVEEKEKELRGE